MAYLVLLGIVTGVSEPSFSAVNMLLAKEVLGALVIGLAVGYLAFFMLRCADSDPAEILITLALATGGYSFAERMHVSAPLAVVVMGLVIGNHGTRSAMSQTTRAHLFSFWELLDVVLNLPKRPPRPRNASTLQVIEPSIRRRITVKGREHDLQIQVQDHGRRPDGGSGR